MTDDTLERLAREAGLVKQHFGSDGLWLAGTTDLARFAALVRADERERCAKVSTWLAVEIDGFAGIDGNVYSAIEQYAAAIRAL